MTKDTGTGADGAAKALLFPLMKDLGEILGPVGHEGPVADYLEKRWKKSCKRVFRTKVGNVVGYLGGEGPKLILTAHMDEINLIIKSIDAQGFIWLTSSHPGAVRRFHLRECLNRRAVILTRKGPVEGIFATLTGHPRFISEKDAQAPAWDDIWVDLGLRSKEEVQALGVNVGCPVLYKAETQRFGHHTVMKAADDRIGLAIMTAFAETVDVKALRYETYLVATIQEEAGMIGACSITNDLGQFDVGIAYEVGLSGDYPGVRERDLPLRLGGGPCVIYKDGSVHYSTEITEALLDLAEKNGIPVQPVIFSGFRTDGSQLIMQGTPTALMAPPTRYTHSPHEMLDEEDVYNCVRLTTAFCTATPHK